MALEFCDGFGHSTLADKWTYIQNGSIATSNPRYTNGSHAYSTSTYPILRKSGLTASPTYWMGMACRWSGAGATACFAFWDGENIQVMGVIDSNGILNFYRGPMNTLLAATATLQNGAWTYIEVKVSIHASTGVLEVRQNGTTVYSSSSLNTKAYGDNINAIGPWTTTGNPSGSNSLAVADLYACSNTGSYNKDFLGDVRVQAILPSGAGNTTQMTPSAGSNYACVDEASPNGDTDYVSETTAGEKDTYVFGNLTPTSGTVKGVQVLIDARKDDAGSRSIAPVYRPVSTDYDGTAVSIGDSYAYYREITEVSPATSAAWTIAEINGAEFGVTLKA